MTKTARFRCYTFVFTLLVFTGSTALLWYHAAPSVSFHDSGQFVVAAATGGLPHPPGAPSWTLGATLFLKLFNFDDPAYGCNLYAGLWGSVTLALLFLVSVRLARRYFLPTNPWMAYVLGLLPPATLLGGSAFIEQSLIVEQYTMMIALMTALVLLFTWIPHWQVASPLLARRLYVIAATTGILWGLAITNHVSQICLVVPIGCYAFIVYRAMGLAFTMRFVGVLILGFVLGCLPFLYLPYVAHRAPLLDWVDAHSFEKFMDAIQRKFWSKRPISDAPPHFIREWFYTYDIIGELGFIGFMLCLGGIVYAVTRRWIPALWFTFMAFPFCAGLFYGHLTQANMDIKYIRYYGVKDWHLPLYIWGAFMALPAAGFLAARFEKFRLVLPVIVAIVLSQSLWTVHASSLRNWNAPHQYITDLKSGLTDPEGNFILLRDDNKSNMLLYDNYVKNGARNLVLYELAQTTITIDSSTDMDALTRRYIKFIRENRQPVNLPESIVDRLPAPVYLDFQPETSPFSRAVLPAGFLYRLADAAPVTSAAVAMAEMDWRVANSDKLRLPGDNPHRLEREAYSVLYWQRGSVFLQHQLYELAAEELKRALQWTPDNGFCWLLLGLTYEQWDSIAYRPQVRLAYESAIQAMEFLDEAHFRLGTLLVNSSKIPEGIAELEKCLELNPDHPGAKLNLQYARSLQSQ